MSYHHGNLREALLERAAEVIAADGIEALSLRALAREGFRRSIDAMDAGAERAGSDHVTLPHVADEGMIHRLVNKR